MQQHPSFAQQIENRISDLIQERLRQIVEEEVAEAQIKVASRMAKAVDEIALQVASSYELERQVGRIIITVKKPEAGE